jgi:hypothetical protein
MRRGFLKVLQTPSITTFDLSGVVSPRASPVVNHVWKGIVIMFYRLVSQVFISWRLMCC